MTNFCNHSLSKKCLGISHFYYFILNLTYFSLISPQNLQTFSRYFSRSGIIQNNGLQRCCLVVVLAWFISHKNLSWKKSLNQNPQKSHRHSQSLLKNKKLTHQIYTIAKSSLVSSGDWENLNFLDYFKSIMFRSMCSKTKYNVSHKRGLDIQKDCQQKSTLIINIL